MAISNLLSCENSQYPLVELILFFILLVISIFFLLKLVW